MARLPRPVRLLDRVSRCRDRPGPSSRASTPGGPSTTRSAAASTAAGVSGPPTATARVSTPAARQPAQGRERRQVAGVVADEAHRGQAGGQLARRTVPLSVGTGGRSSHDILPGCATSPDRAASAGRELGGPSASFGRLAKVQGDGQALGSTRTPAGAALRPAGRGRDRPPASGRRPGRGGSRRPRAIRSRPYSPTSSAARRVGAELLGQEGHRPAGDHRRPGRTGRPGGPGPAPLPGRGRAWSGTSTMGARVPSKSRNTPDVPGEASQGRSRPSSTGRPASAGLRRRAQALPARSGPMTNTRLAVVALRGRDGRGRPAAGWSR